ncbi:MAG TPA: PQ-loop repeat-containing protein [Pyrinomonadaceae bacterium]
MLGWAGTALVIVAYIPQIHHLYVERCAWGISISTWLIWLAAGALLLSYSIFRNDTLFTFVQVINITAIVATVMLARRSNRICPYHLRSDLEESAEVEKVNDRALSNRGITAHDAEAEAR